MPLKKTLATTSLLIALALSPDAKAEFQQIILYKNDFVPQHGNTHADWEANGNSYSAGIVPLRFDIWKKQGKVITQAIAQIVLQATSSIGYTGTAIGLCGPLVNGPHLDGGNCQILSFVAANNVGFADYTPSMYTPWDSTPTIRTGTGSASRPFWADVTSEMNNFIRDGQPLFMNILGFGDGQDGQVVYDVELLVEWQ